jgi:hypothetical protein
LVLGFLLGGIGPRRAATEARERVGELEKRAEQAERRGGRVRYLPLPGLDQLARDDADASQVARRSPQERQRPGTAPRGDAATPLGGPGGGDAGRERAGAGGVARLQAAVDAQRLRSAQSRAALGEGAKLSEDELGRVDAVVARMNQALARHASQLIELVQSGEQPKPVELLWISREVTGILYDAQSEFEEVVGPERLEQTEDSAKQIWNYVDLEPIKAAAERARDGGA